MFFPVLSDIAQLFLIHYEFPPPLQTWQFGIVPDCHLSVRLG
jgi:hypothetical protein